MIVAGSDTRRVEVRSELELPACGVDSCEI